ncbi:MAG: histidine phosphatase family protein [Desulfobacterales bacterium]|nr:MAG: histidine phosphatase family protein [Desulfobacterales bacterium]
MNDKSGLIESVGDAGASTDLWQDIEELPGLQLNQTDGRIRYQKKAGAVIRLRRPTIWIRHGQTDNNLHKKLNGSRAQPPGSLLNAVGKKQTAAMAQTLYADLVRTLEGDFLWYVKGQKIKVWVSPLTRAQETAEAFQQYFYDRIQMDFPQEEIPRLSWKVRDELKEHSYGILDGLNPSSGRDLSNFRPGCRKTYRELGRQWRELDSADVKWPAGETFIEGTLRLKVFFEERSSDPEDGIDMTFSHGILGNSARVLIRDQTLLSPEGDFLAIRNNVLKNGQPVWLKRPAQTRRAS